LLEYIKCWSLQPEGALTLKSELKIFSLPVEIAKEILLEFIEFWELSHEAEEKIFSLPPEIAKEILLKYLDITSLRQKDELKILDLPAEIAREILSKYDKKCELFPETEKRAKELGLL
jgi:hypothetical protein